eukprot:gene17687-23277_t
MLRYQRRSVNYLIGF